MNNVREFEQLQDKINLHVLHKKTPIKIAQKEKQKGHSPISVLITPSPGDIFWGIFSSFYFANIMVCLVGATHTHTCMNISTIAGCWADGGRLKNVNILPNPMLCF